MKIAIIADTHAGARNDSPRFDAYFRRFYEEVFFPQLRKEKITTIIHLGDIFDRRKYINFQTLQNVREYFFDRLREYGITMYAIAGNHDTYYKNTNAVNSIRLLLDSYLADGTIVLVDQEPTERIIGGRNFHFIPWMCDQNEAACLNLIRRAERSDICIGHFELDGYEMYRGIRHEGGLSREVLSTYLRVFTGHFHTRSHEDNVFYLGSPYEYTWSDFDDPRGFHFYDTTDDTLEFVENPLRMHHKIFYNDELPLPQPEVYEGCCVKVIVQKKTDYTKFEQFIDAMFQHNVEELTISEDYTDFSGGDISDDKLNMEDTMTLLRGFIDAVDSDKDKNRVKMMMETLYVEAQNREV